MGLYLYQNPNTKEIIEVVQKMNDEHTFFKDGINWIRLFTSPCPKIGINPFSQEDWNNQTRNTRGTIGDLWDKSAELSEKRAKKSGGIDPIKQKTAEAYRKKTGKPHPHE